MKIEQITDRSDALVHSLTELWERSVRATHHFLSDDEIAAIRPYVPEAIRGVSVFLTANTDDGTPTAFIGVENHRIKMLFVDPRHFRRGIGRALLEHVLTHFGADAVTVNEQNPEALAFYEHLGFVVEKRTPTDEAGRPYPLLYLRLTKPAA